MNKRAKGNRAELECKKSLRGDGWLCEVKNWSRWSGKDFWGLFDVIAVRGCEVRLIQVKTNRSDMYKARKDIRIWKEENNISLVCEVWLKEPRKEWRVERV